MDLAVKVGLSAQERLLTRHEIYNADEVFLTGTAAEIIPVVKVDGRAISEGKPGVKTSELLKEFRKLTKTEGLRYAL
jgi:branched-chain amino acid aminotransferase